jgi:hypothetical protein
MPALLEAVRVSVTRTAEVLGYLVWHAEHGREERLSWLSSVVLAFDDLTRRVPAQGWRAAPPPWAAAPLTDPAPCQLDF